MQVVEIACPTCGRANDPSPDDPKFLLVGCPCGTVYERANGREISLFEIAEMRCEYYLCN